MTGQGWPEEQKPELYDSITGPYDEMNGLLETVAGMMTERAYSAMVEGSDTQEVASELLGSTAILASLGYTSLYNLSGGIDRYTAEVDPAIARY